MKETKKENLSLKTVGFFSGADPRYSKDAYNTNEEEGAREA